MNKFNIVKQMRANEDSVVTIKGEEPIVATLNFKTKYIKDQKYGKFTILKDCILMFSWTDNKFRNIKIKDIRDIKPLSATLNNPSPEIKIDG